MKTETIVFLALLYACAVFCVCAFKKLRAAVSALFSRRNIKNLRAQTAGGQIVGKDVSEEMKRAVGPVLRAWRDADEKALPARMDKTFLARMRRILEVLKKYGVRRELRLSGVWAAYDEKGKQDFRKWNEGGREWRECVLYAALLESYVHARGGEILQEKYYPDARITVVQSRHVRYEDAVAEAKSRKDKFGYTKKKRPETVFYEESRQIVCKSCGAEIEVNAQQVSCPYCGGQIFSDFHDWQTEHFSVEPVQEYPTVRAAVSALIAFAASFSVHLALSSFKLTPFWALAASLGVIVLTVAGIAAYTSVLDSVQEKRKKKIVRFSEHQFKSCVYEALWEQFRTQEVLDFFLGNIKLREVRNAGETTEVTISVPLYTQLWKNGAVAVEKTKWSGVFSRARYPERLKSKGAVAEERECPSCGGNFIPDAHGCCSFCGYGLKTDNAKWRLKQ